MSETSTPFALKDLMESPFGQRMGESICNELLPIAVPLDCSPTETLFEEGDSPEGIYLVLDGQLKLIRSGPGYREYIVHLAERLSMFGEASLFLAEHPVTATALEPSRIMFLPREPFLEIMHRHTQLQQYIMQDHRRWMTKLIDQIDQLTLCDGAQRLARYLVTLHEKSPYSGYLTSAQVELPTRKRDLATMLNMNQPSLSRILRQFQDND